MPQLEPILKWSGHDQRKFIEALKELRRNVKGWRINRMVYYPARHYVRQAARATKIGKKADYPKAWWPDATQEHAQWIDTAKYYKGYRVSLAVEARRRTREPIGGRGFARRTWTPIADRLSVTLTGPDEWRATTYKRGRQRLNMHSRSAARTRKYLEYKVRMDGEAPYIVIHNKSEAVINQDRGSKGMPPRHIHKKGMTAAYKEVLRQLEDAKKRIGKAWR